MTGLILWTARIRYKNELEAASASSESGLWTSLGNVVGNVHYQLGVGLTLLSVCFGKVKSGALADQLITFTRCLRETLPIQNRELPSTIHIQTGTLQLPDSIRDGRPLDPQHFGEQILSDRQCIIVTAVTHHEQPTRQSLLQAMRNVACYRHQDLLEKSLNVSIHEVSEGRHRLHSACERRARHLCCAPWDLDEKPD